MEKKEWNYITLDSPPDFPSQGQGVIYAWPRQARVEPIFYPIARHFESTPILH